MNKKLHYFSGIVLSIFIALHLLNHLGSIWGAEVHIQSMNYLRILYRNIVIETLLFCSVSIQIFSGLRLVYKRKTLKLSFFQIIQNYSGLYLSFFLLVHLSAIMVGRYYLELDTNFYFGVAGLNTFPINLFFIPYYALALISVFTHLAVVHKTKTSIKIISPQAQFYIIMILGTLITIGIFYGLTSHFQGIDIPEEYRI
ncbi:hypothetical protein Lbys_3464 [Leadbetterella byssophila DSM 17132]|uniref:Uncharacterized protein n=1 Tax=Leadbetterella byssophila (strain DSM 17132 / JCM 16389 / KACC 11308 / NBRC 106382 / 4M15) TaxID=649349 RepID=E4RYI2_LEAB4|nr:hypothetical protein [Leadbetterella byssophila]ADQ19112.1 hypothetical protein Lbys_3464 [Leadbetterella byssophila DSM 17132]